MGELPPVPTQGKLNRDTICLYNFACIQPHLFCLLLLVSHSEKSSLDEVWTPEFFGETSEDTHHPYICCKGRKLNLMFKNEEYCIEIDKEQKQYTVELYGVVHSGSSLRKLMDEVYKVGPLDCNISSSPLS